MTSTAVAIDLEITWRQLQQDWSTRLARHGVPDIGELNDPPGCVQLQLIYLRHFLGMAVSKHDMATWIQGHNPCCGLDPQARHWKRAGWDVQGRGGFDAQNKPLPNGCYCLASLNPSTDFLTKRTRDLGRVAATDWDSLKLAYNNRCAICGASGVPLEQGHMDPREPLVLANTVPLCEACNRWQLDRFVIDDRGRVATVLPTASNQALFAALNKRERQQLIHLIGTA
jgi:hypothetical protein